MAGPVDFEHVTKHFGSTVALDDVSFSLEPGEILGFLGPNGAGKTTALRVALGLLHPNAGRVTIGGAVAGSAEARARVGYVAGDVALWPRLTGAETLEFMASLHGSVDRDYRAALVERFQLDLDKRVRAYSKGNRQKLAIVAALSSRAPVLLLDEPTTGLDPLVEKVFRECLVEAVAAGRSALLSSHELNAVEHLCKRVVMIRGGRIIQAADVADLRRRARAVYDVAGEVGDLTRVPGVTSVEPIEGGVRVYATGSPAALLSALGAAGATALSTREASLEEIFLSYYDGPS